ncbi:retrovirus-related pol polyprotein from transposon TNT 1-94 [Tanacetum coccineum]
MAAEVPQTLEYRGGQLNAAPILEVENFTNWKKRNINHVKESELASLFGKLKYVENLIDNFQYSPDDEDDTSSSQEYLNDLEEEYKERALLDKSKRFFKKGYQRFSSTKPIDDTICHKCGRKGHFARNCFSKTSVPSYSSPFQKPQTTIFSPSQQKPELRPNKDFEAKYNKVKAKLALFSSGTSSKPSMVKNKGLVAEAYEWDEEDVSLDDNEMTEVKVLMALADDENVDVGKESARNGEWVKIFIRKVHILLDMEDNDERKSFIDYLCIDLNYVEEQRNNLVLKHRDLIQELNTCKEQLLVLKQAKLDFLTMQHVNTKILKENKNLRKRILGLDQLTKDPSSSGQTDLVFGKSSAEDTKVSILGVERPWLFKAEGFLLPNHDTGRAESQVKRTDPLVAITDSSATEYDSADESSVYITPLPPLEKLAGVTINEPSSAHAKAKASDLKTDLAPVGKLKNVKTEDDFPLDSSDIRKPVWYLDSGCSRHMNGVKIYLHKYVEQPGPKVVFGDDSTCVTEGYGSIKCNGIVFTKVAFVNDLTYNLVSISQLYDAKYIVQVDEKIETIFNSNKEIVMIAPRVKDVYVLDMTSSAQESYFFAKATEISTGFGTKDLLI